jgi:hypothetical protein
LAEGQILGGDHRAGQERRTKEAREKGQDAHLIPSFPASSGSIIAHFSTTAEAGNSCCGNEYGVLAKHKQLRAHRPDLAPFLFDPISRICDNAPLAVYPLDLIIVLGFVSAGGHLIMKPQFPICLPVFSAAVSPALADGTVTLDLSSPSDGMAVPGSHVIEWAITAAVSTGDNMGLALISVDLVQDADNPELFDIPQAVGVPPGMEGFDRPDGISNPGPEESCYGGTQVGLDGAKNLAQIGGSQNTFGTPSGGIGLDVDVDAGVGQGPGGQEIATNSFPAPAIPGVYTFSIPSAVANTLEAVNPAPQWSPVSPATVVLGNPSISFTVCRPGDIDGDFTLTVEQDVPLFVNLLLGTGSSDDYAQCAADLNGDGTIDGKDIQPFVDALLPG